MKPAKRYTKRELDKLASDPRVIDETARRMLESGVVGHVAQTLALWRRCEKEVRRGR